MFSRLRLPGLEAGRRALREGLMVVLSSDLAILVLGFTQILDGRILP